MNINHETSNGELCAGDIHEQLGALILAGRKFRTIMIDPPWPYRDKGRPRGGIAAHYRGMDLSGIYGLPLPQIADKNASLHLWTTTAFLEESFSLLRVWGFTYRGVMLWCKPPPVGTGAYWRNCVEFLLLATRGRVSFPNSPAVPNWFVAERLEHSQKPAMARRLIMSVCEGPYLELFARGGPVHEWTRVGDQLDLEQQSLF